MNKLLDGIELALEKLAMVSLAILVFVGEIMWIGLLGYGVFRICRWLYFLIK